MAASKKTRLAKKTPKKVVNKTAKKKTALKPAKKNSRAKTGTRSKAAKTKVRVKSKTRSAKVAKSRPSAKRKAKKKSRPLDLRRSEKNPVISPSNDSYWESEGAFNPGAVIHGGRVHLFYRALGPDGISRVGYASSKDGIHFDVRHPHPVYMPELSAEQVKKFPYTSPARPQYDRTLYASGGGWGGCEDPRAVKIGGRIYLTFNMFNGWHSIRVGMTSISEKDLEAGHWRWRSLVYLSPANERHKNWVIFPEQIDGKYAVLHNLYHEDPHRVRVEYIDDLEEPPEYFHSPDPHLLPNREVSWHHRTRGAGPPPIKTKYGWLLFYHAMDKNDPGKYKLGVALLDSKDPGKVLYRSRYPILEPDEWYENDWKPGIIYASGAIVKDNTLFIYYGGGDKYIGVAHVDLDDFIKRLMRNEHASLAKGRIKIS